MDPPGSEPAPFGPRPSASARVAELSMPAVDEGIARLPTKGDARELLGDLARQRAAAGRLSRAASMGCLLEPVGGVPDHWTKSVGLIHQQWGYKWMFSNLFAGIHQEWGYTADITLTSRSARHRASGGCFNVTYRGTSSNLLNNLSGLEHAPGFTPLLLQGIGVSIPFPCGKALGG